MVYLDQASMLAALAQGPGVILRQVGIPVAVCRLTNRLLFTFNALLVPLLVLKKHV